MATSEKIYQLIQQWCNTLDASRASEVLRQIAIHTGCIPDVPRQLSEQDNKRVIHWLQENYPHAYLWAVSQQCVGHPAMVWGTVKFSSPSSH